MLTSTHIGFTLGASLQSDIKHVARAGFDGIELSIPKLREYLASHTEDDLIHALGSLRVSMIDVLMPIECHGHVERRELAKECARWAALAGQLGCPALQVVALDGFFSDAWIEQRAVLVESLKRLADQAAPHGVRLALEPVCFSPFRTLEQAHDLLELIGRESVGLVLDTWHLWVSGTDWADVAALDPADIVTVQVGDCHPRRGSSWCDADRTALPGDGIVPIHEVLTAICRTGYAGFWSTELFGMPGNDAGAVYRALLERLKRALERARIVTNTESADEEVAL